MSNDIDSFLIEISNTPITRVLSVRDYQDNGSPCVFIGCGAWPTIGTAIPSHQLRLNNKGTAGRFPRTYSSVTKLVFDPPNELLESWEYSKEWPVSPATALNHLTLVVEDASPDSVFGMLLLLARIAGIDFGKIAAPIWIEAIDDWEVNGNASDPLLSWCSLASALAHSHFPISAEVSEEHFANAWTDVLHFAAAALLRSLPPHSIPSLPELPEWKRADTATRQEKDVYLDWLPHATKVQLSLPLSVGQGRRTLIDGLLFIEDQATGAAKVYYRNDRERSPLGQGFALAAHYRPSIDGKGDAITISVDTRRGIDLRDLWSELERRETAAWMAAGEKRPDYFPRKLQGISNTYNQPWYISPDGTLIGAPTMLPSGVPGSKLSWADVRSCIWTVYHPLQNVKVSDCKGGHLKPLLELSPEAIDEHDKLILIAYWPRQRTEIDGPIARALSTAPIVPRVLAALVERKNAQVPLSLDNLPVDGAWDRVDLSGGFIIVTNNGLFALDDWHEANLSVDAIRQEFHRAARLDKALRGIESGTIRPLVNEVRSLLDHSKSLRGAERLVRKAALTVSRLTELRGSHALPPDDPNARQIWEALDRRWHLDRRLAALEAEGKAIETSLRSLSELRLGRIGRLVAILGFPIMVANVLGALISKYLYSLTLPISISAPPIVEPPSWFLIITFIGIWGIVMTLLLSWLWLEGRIEHR